MFLVLTKKKVCAQLFDQEKRFKICWKIQVVFFIFHFEQLCVLHLWMSSSVSVGQKVECKPLFSEQWIHYTEKTKIIKFFDYMPQISILMYKKIMNYDDSHSYLYSVPACHVTVYFIQYTIIIVLHVFSMYFFFL